VSPNWTGDDGVSDFDRSLLKKKNKKERHTLPTKKWTDRTVRRYVAVPGGLFGRRWAVWDRYEQCEMDDGHCTRRAAEAHARTFEKDRTP
jgi:hypothetical protein